MTRNLKVFFVSLVISLPFWFGVDVFSAITTQALTTHMLKSDPGVFAATVAHERLNRQIQEAYPLRAKAWDSLELSADAARATLVKNDGSTKVLFSQYAEQPVLIASLTKLMTALVALEVNLPAATVAITPDIIAVEGDTGQLQEFEVFTVRDLLYLALIESSNDAATALTVPIGYHEFIHAMNVRATSLAMHTASFENPTGLDSTSANSASAYDLTKLAIHIKEHYPQIFDILSQQQFPIRTADGIFHHNLINTNELLGYRDWPTKVLGGKTGWTPHAKQALLLVVESPDKQGYIVSVILGSDDRFGEMKQLLAWMLDSYQWEQKK